MPYSFRVKPRPRGQSSNHGETALHTIHILDWHPTPLNKLLGHWARSSKLKKLDRGVIAYYFADIPKAAGKRRVSLEIVLGKGQRACDPDAYWKSLLDALVHAGQLVNDSPKWVELAPVKFSRSIAGATITLEDIA